MGSAAASGLARRLTVALGGAERTRVIIVLAAILGLSGADAATVGASASELRSGLHITNTDIGLLVAVSSLVGAFASLPFGVLADRVTRTRILGLTIVTWGAAMLWSATASDFRELLWTRLFLGAVTASAGPMVASLVGDWFGSWERGRIYGVILAGEYVGAGIGFAVTGNIAALSWRAAFVILALPAFVLALVVWRLREPERGGKGVLASDKGGPSPDALAQADEGAQTTDAQRLARERGLDARPPARRRAREGTAHEPLARHPLRAARANEPDPDRRQRVRLLLPRRPTDVRPGVLEGPVRDRPGAREHSPARDRRRIPGRSPRRRHARRLPAEAWSVERARAGRPPSRRRSRRSSSCRRSSPATR